MKNKKGVFRTISLCSGFLFVELLCNRQYITVIRLRRDAHDVELEWSVRVEEGGVT